MLRKNFNEENLTTDSQFNLYLIEEINKLDRSLNHSWYFHATPRANFLVTRFRSIPEFCDVENLRIYEFTVYSK
jgi:hypothetical protein